MQIKQFIKRQNKKRSGKYLSPVRRIERVKLPKGKRLVAMTFDDGPSSALPVPEVAGAIGLTEHLLDVLKSYNARATFDVIGDTSGNYPDKKGMVHTPQWGGVAHDHYPNFNMDMLGGMANVSSVAQRLVAEQEVANHTYRHVLFGAMPYVYRQRQHYEGLQMVVEDLLALHNLVYEIYGKSITLSRPPHYVDKIKGGVSSYDAYALMGYHYMAASYDGGGWKPTSGNYEQDVLEMIRAIEEPLKKEPNFFAGQIIFQKDGFNMSEQTPIADALEKQLEILISHGYQVVGVEELIQDAPFEDYGEGDLNFEMARSLDRAGYIVGYKNNTFQPNRLLTFGELVTMTTPCELYTSMLSSITNNKKNDAGDSSIWYDCKSMDGGLSTKHPYYWHYKYAVSKGYHQPFESLPAPSSRVTPDLFADYLHGVNSKVGKEHILSFFKNQRFISRVESLPFLAKVLL